jgi:hypothetical protein
MVTNGLKENEALSLILRKSTKFVKSLAEAMLNLASAKRLEFKALIYLTICAIHSF